MMQTLSPRKRPKPPTMAASSPNLRSPASGVKSSISAGDVVEAVRPLRMARDLRLLPGRQVRVDLLERERRLDLEPADLLADGDRLVALAHGAQFLDLGLQFGHGLFEVEIGAHGSGKHLIGK